MHRHQYKGRKLSRKSGPRKALISGLISQVILHESITTTVEKAKEIRPTLEKLVTKAKNGSLADRRNAAKILSSNDRALEKLFAELGPLYKERKGGYCRILKIGARSGDNAAMAQIQLLDTEKLTKKEIEVSKSKKIKEKTTKVKDQKAEKSIPKKPAKAKEEKK